MPYLPCSVSDKSKFKIPPPPSISYKIWYMEQTSQHIFSHLLGAVNIIFNKNILKINILINASYFI